MQSLEGYQKDYEEIQKLKNSLLAGRSVTIEFDKLDSKTAGEIKNALHDILSKRSRKLYAILTSGSNI